MFPGHNGQMGSPGIGRRHLDPPAAAKRVRGERGEIAYWELGSGLYVTCVRGGMTRAMSQLIIEEADKLYAGGGTVYGFHDWLLMTHYESACRIELTDWVLSHRAQSVLHIGVASKVVAMGVAVANLMLGSLIHVHTKERTLEQALHDALQRAGR